MYLGAHLAIGVAELVHQQRQQPALPLGLRLQQVLRPNQSKRPPRQPTVRPGSSNQRSSTTPSCCYVRTLGIIIVFPVSPTKPSVRACGRAPPRGVIKTDGVSWRTRAESILTKPGPCVCFRRPTDRMSVTQPDRSWPKCGRSHPRTTDCCSFLAQSRHSLCLHQTRARLSKRAHAAATMCFPKTHAPQSNKQTTASDHIAPMDHALLLHRITSKVTCMRPKKKKTQGRVVIAY